ncbi:MAG: hypothetical protein MZW92_73150 [Comamonadaceae bacterium]|nr:hypothetical protein [Comamonadaceae bacterium]
MAWAAALLPARWPASPAGTERRGRRRRRPALKTGVAAAAALDAVVLGAVKRRDADFAAARSGSRRWESLAFAAHEGGLPMPRIPTVRLAVATAAALLSLGAAAQNKTLVYCSEGSPENFTPALNTTGTSFDAAPSGLRPA